MATSTEQASARVTAVLRHLVEARRLGYLGPGPVDTHIAHARGFATVAARVAVELDLDGGMRTSPPPAVTKRNCAALPWAPTTVVDLGSGGGVPGLILALEWPVAQVTLVDASTRRCELLRRAVTGCDLGERVSVVQARAEELGRDDGWRGAAQVVVARSFGPPPVTAECAAPLLSVGGLLVVSEPPGAGDPARWPAQGLAMLGIGTVRHVQADHGFQVMVQRSPCPARFPRRVGIPAKRPLF